ncbi:tetratricopeptide repeat-containing protein [Aromatoleum buckelii]|uniref:tetratricopeptide repeat-containing protein n=1 Tax=Aromatoleum buckelii TaxID=200254 RepID=UPI00145D7542|nr:tetratricopeptide repeat-containing protein [Aromatoleum buckelii]MCK0509769.1 tetratricopeptide repeat protein [Aromatoleum buckelii]
MLRAFFIELLARPFILSKPIKVFYGVGGAGKTALREKSINDFRAEMQDQGGPPLAFAQVDLDSDTFTPEYPIFDFFSRHLRTALKHAGCSLPLFDIYCLAWKARMAESAAFSRDEIEEFLGAPEKVSEVVGSIWAQFTDLATSIKGVNLALKAAIAFRDSRRAKRYAERFPNLELAELASADFEKHAHDVLAGDLLDFLEAQGERNSHPYALCIAVDGFERIQSTTNARNSQWALQALCDRLATHEPQPRCGFVFFGRNRVLWRILYDHRDDAPEETWDALIEQHCVGGLSLEDARLFLGQVMDWYTAHATDSVCGQILQIMVTNGDAILDAAEESPAESTERSFHPFALDLAIKQIGTHRDHFDSRVHLGHGHKDLQERFLRYMPASQLSALQSLALALEFDEGVFQVLVSRHVIKGIQIQDFHDLVGPDNSHVLPIGQTYRFHSKMQEALLSNLKDQQNGPKKAETVINVLVAHYSELLAQGVRQHATGALLAAFTRASDILLSHAQTGLLDAEVFRSAFFTLEDSLPIGLLASARKTAWIRASAILAERLDADSPYALEARANIAAWTGQAGDPGAALALFKALLPEQQRVLRPDDPDTLRARGHIAAWTGQAGDAGAALALYKGLLPDQQRVLGPDHQDTLTTRGNIAAWTGQIGEPGAALALSKTLLPDQQRVLGPDHPNTLATRGNIAAWTGAAGDADAALALYKALLPDRQRMLSPDHPDTLAGRGHIAHWTGRAGDAGAALALYKALLPDQQRVLGPDHPDTLRTRGNIAAWTGQAGDVGAALALYKALLPDQQRVLGPDHPDVLTTRGNIAAWTGHAGDAGGALALSKALLPDQQRVLGPDHPDTLTTRGNIAAWTGQAGDAGAALALYKALLPDQQRVLDLDHPDTQGTRANIAAWTGHAGDACAALALYKALLPDQQRVLGPDHPDTLRTRANIAAWTGQAGDASAALALSMTLLPDQQRVLGPDHPNTLTSRGNIAHWTGQAGDAGAALALSKALLTDQQRVLGPDHPETLGTQDWIVHFETQKR